MRRRLGIRARVVGAFAAVMLVLLVAAGLAIRSGVADQLTDSGDSQLETRAAAVARLIVERGGPEPRLTEGLDDPGESFTQVVDARGRVVLATDGLPATPLVGPAQREEAGEGITIRLEGVELAPDEGDEELDTEALEDTDPEPFEDDRARVIARSVTVDGRRYLVIVGDTLEDREDALRALSRVLLVALPLSLLAACIVGWLAIGAALRPVDLMRRRASGISERSLAERLPLPAGDDELRRLGETLNAMLARLQAALERERGFVADASHELRTPLAVLRTELELAMRAGRSEEELREAVASALEETTQLGALADGLLTLAQADEGALGEALATEPVDVRDLLEEIAARYDDAVTVSPATAPVTVPADELRLGQAVANLVENAVRHGGGEVELRAEVLVPGAADGSRPAGGVSGGGGVRIIVADRGPGIPEAFLPHAFDRFARADASRTTAGTGLGLPIVQAIVDAHGGSVALAPRHGGGTEATITLPA